MKFVDCKESMRVRYERPGGQKHGWTGTITSLDDLDGEVTIDWDNGRDDIFNGSIQYLVPIEVSAPQASKAQASKPANVSKPGKPEVNEDFKFFAAVPSGCCPCGIPRASKRCNFH